MAKPTTWRGTQLLIKIGNGATPEVLEAPCGLTSTSLNRSADTNDTTVPDCDNPDAPAWTEREVSTLSWEYSGSGVMTPDAAKKWDAWHASGLPKNVQIDAGTAALDGRRYTGRALLTTYNITGERGDKIKVEVTLSGDGELHPADLV